MLYAVADSPEAKDINWHSKHSLSRIRLWDFTYLNQPTKVWEVFLPEGERLLDMAVNEELLACVVSQDGGDGIKIELRSCLHSKVYTMTMNPKFIRGPVHGIVLT